MEVSFKDIQLGHQPKGLTLITSTIDLSPLWLVDLIASKSGEQTLLVTFRNTRALHEKGLKRLGIDINSSKRVSILDISDQLFPISQGQFTTASLDSITKSITNTIEKCYGNGHAGEVTVILEYPDVLLSSAAHKGLEAAKVIGQIQRACGGGLYVSCNGDEPLIGLDESSSLAHEQSTFLAQLVHQCNSCISLRPLSTGRAHDVTGIFRITRGPRVVSTQSVSDAEYLYFVSGDSVKFFYR
uniref:ARAD1D06094p n=1 Tax=Blastobotrys adeninivorans TaxID=409370 RepID=A0A060T8W4_BLAAD